MQETENLLEVAKKRIKEGRKEDDREVLPTKFKTLERILANYRESLAKYAHRIEGPDPNASECTVE